MPTATATAHPNIALVKYWGKRELSLNLPAVSSLSLTLDGFYTRTRVTWGAETDAVRLDGVDADARTRDRVLRFLDRLSADRPPCHVHSTNNFPAAAGLASSSSAFAALALAATRAAGHTHSPAALSALARQGSGSACRSLWGGFVVWHRGERTDGMDSHGIQIARADHWDVSMVVAVVSTARKAVGSTEGMMRSERTSALYPTWVAQAEADVAEGRAAVLDRDLERLGRVMESSTFKMHASMMTADPPLLYWLPGSVACLQTVFALRRSGVSAWATMDAGPQVKVLCASSDAPRVRDALAPHATRVHILGPGGDPRVAREPS